MDFPGRILEQVAMPSSRNLLDPGLTPCLLHSESIGRFFTTEPSAASQMVRSQAEHLRRGLSMRQPSVETGEQSLIPSLPEGEGFVICVGKAEMWEVWGNVMGNEKVR